MEDMSEGAGGREVGGGVTGLGGAEDADATRWGLHVQDSMMRMGPLSAWHDVCGVAFVFIPCVGC